MFKSKQKGFTVIELLMGLWALFCVVCVVALICVIVHFVGKFW